MEGFELLCYDTLRNEILVKDDSLGNISKTFSTMIDNQEHFKALCVLCMLIHDDLLSKQEALTALFILYDYYREQNDVNPFTLFFIDCLEGRSRNDVGEKWFLLQIVLNQDMMTEISRMKPEVLAQHVAQNHVDVSLSDIEMLRTKFESINIPVPANRASGVRPVIRDPKPLPIIPSDDSFDIKSSSDPLNPDTKSDSTSPSSSSLSSKQKDRAVGPFTLLGFEPEIDVPLPPMMPPDADEFIWLLPREPEFFSWDQSVDTDNFPLQRIMDDAITSELSDADMKQLTSAMEDDSSLVGQLVFPSPDKIEGLVLKNKELAAEVLAYLVTSPSQPEYLSALLKMQVSFASMDVVNALSQKVSLPVEFVLIFISNCIRSCDVVGQNMHTDSETRLRLVRQVCEFIKALLERKIVPQQDVSVEVQAFCVNHKTQREARALYRKLRQEAGEK
eukprot:TRINITY_DN2592_c0_g1_i1.p1 TRINITY_DN2592_c0_g1~~TRINITY_DN2592_c0_g1_i1.p1  ORF type:complete len:447 (-),score=90.05 TRINITY_DN2592_c0_g1_i1:2071-3411(-)